MLNQRLRWLLAALLFFPAALPAQNAQALTEAQKKERAITADMEVEGVELVALEKEIAHAMGLHNSSFFQRVFNDDYLGTAPSGQILDRSTLVASIQNSNIKFFSVLATDIRVRIYGPTAVVTCIWSQRGIRDGHDFARQSRVIHVFLNNRVGGWKVVAGQETILPG